MRESVSTKCSALHVAVALGHRKVCTFLLDAGASLHLVDENGDTPLHYAAYYNRPEITDLLLSRGAAVGAVNNDRYSALHVAAKNGHREVCIFHLDAGASLHLVNVNGDTPLHCAAYSNQPEIMDLLLSRGAAIDVVDNNKCSALHAAVNKHHVQCVRVLLRYDCDVNLQDSHGITALHDAITENAQDIIDALCEYEKVDFTLRNKLGFNILQQAAFEGNAHAMKRLITLSRHLVDVKMDDGTAALHLAALNGHREVAAILLSQNGGRATVDLRNNQGQTPLHLATSQGHWPLVELLVHHNADVSSMDEDGNTVLHIACCTTKSPNQQIVVPTPESSRDSPLIHAIWQNLARQSAQTELALVCFLISADKSCKLLMQVRNNKNTTPFDLLEDKQQVAVLAYFLEFYKCQSYSTQLKLKEILSTAGYVEHRIDNMSQTDGLRGANKNIASSGDVLISHEDCSAIIANTKQENRIDPSSSITFVGCSHPVNTQTIQDGQVATDEASNTDKSKDVSSESKRKEDIREKDNDQEPLRLQMLRYLMTKIPDFDEANMCNVCVGRRRNVAFLCGHCACEHCAEQLNTCHICRKTITKKIKLY